MNPQSRNTSINFCLIAIEKGKTETAMVEKAAKSKGRKTVIVHNGEDALQLMKMRNWDAVLLDEDLPILVSTQCISRFWEWEE